MKFPGEFNFGAWWTIATPAFYGGGIELYQISQKLFIVQISMCYMKHKVHEDL
jgi:hypothetical protein